MGNHYDLLAETPDGNLARGIRQLNGVYTQRFNQAYSRVGHVVHWNIVFSRATSASFQPCGSVSASHASM